MSGPDPRGFADHASAEDVGLGPLTADDIVQLVKEMGHASQQAIAWMSPGGGCCAPPNRTANDYCANSVCQERGRANAEEWATIAAHAAHQLMSLAERGTVVLGAFVHGWQPIDTYDGSGEDSVLVVDENGNVGEAHWLGDDDGWWWINNDPTDTWGRRIYPTLWMPLPEAPR